jgi:hypothetical protein
MTSFDPFWVKWKLQGTRSSVPLAQLLTAPQSVFDHMLFNADGVKRLISSFPVAKRPIGYDSGTVILKYIDDWEAYGPLVMWKRYGTEFVGLHHDLKDAQYSLRQYLEWQEVIPTTTKDPFRGVTWTETGD